MEMQGGGYRMDVESFGIFESILYDWSTCMWSVLGYRRIGTYLEIIKIYSVKKY
jgi:hypothetical protein